MRKRLTAGALVAAATVSSVAVGAVAAPPAAAAPVAAATTRTGHVRIRVAQRHAWDKVLLTSRVFDLPRNDRIVSYAVDFGDGSRLRHGRKLPRLLYGYSSAGMKTVRVAVLDQRGRVFRAADTVEVRMAARGAGPVPGRADLPVPGRADLPGCDTGGAQQVAGPVRPVAMPAEFYPGMYAAINSYRTAHGVRTVGVEASLATAASNWAYDIAAGSTRLAHGDLPSCLSGQAIAVGTARSLKQVTSAGLLSLLASDAEHQAVLLQSQAKAGGVGVWFVPSLGEDIAVLDLGAP